MMENSNVRILNWDESSRVLKNVIGCEPKQLANISHSEKNKPFYCKRINDWQSFNDEEIFAIINGCLYLESDVYMICDVSYSQCKGVFHLKSSEVSAYVSNYYDTFGEYLFEDDVYFIFPKNKKLLVYQHEGYHMLYSLPLTHL
ncbi:hypothetical protein [Rahnella victoriana]|uniref:hypothetical protein n=1 Tax=Rahnella victoriana TaxID=1510570 RepID=UPI000E6B9C61|nr:hypothetical protein [Rahnella victoriana]UHM89761.1 hypothetical protein J9880_15800 [Rahnella victoriana]